MMKISRPRRVMMLGKPNCGILELLKELTGSAPAPFDESMAGLSHVWNLKTDYYEVELPIWIDEVSDVSAWKSDFFRPEARDVMAAVGAWVYCFRQPVADEDLEFLNEALAAITAAIKNFGGNSWDGTFLAVATPQSITPHLEKTIEEWEAICSEHGFEYVDSGAKGRNTFGEYVGVKRLKEALETTDWETDTTLDLEELDDINDDPDGESTAEFDIELAELNRELLQMKTSLGSGADGEDDDESDQESKVENLTSMMASLQAIREAGASMPEQQRKAFAAKAVNKIMKTL